MPSSPLRRRLRAAGHHLSPVVQVGKDGVTEGVLRQLDRALLDHELVKVKVGSETPEDRFEAAEAMLEGSAGAHLAQILGRTLLLYRRHPEKPRHEPLPASAGAAARARPTRAERQARAADEARARRMARPDRTRRSTRAERTGGTSRPPRASRPARPDRPGRPPRR